MLPKDLLEVKKIKGRIYPAFAKEEDLELAAKVIKIFKLCIGSKYKLIQSAIRKIENARNYKKVRGFARVVEKECSFDKSTTLDPRKVRMFLFERGYTTSLEEREKVLKEAASYFCTSVEEVESAIFADYSDELILKSVPELSPEELIRRYNLSLLQTAIFNSLRLSFWISSNHKNVFRKIKMLGLMYELYERNGKLITDITGTASILKMTRKYGTSMAKLIPEILRAKNWWIKAEVVDENKRVYFLELTDLQQNLFPAAYSEEIKYDSYIEEEFARRIKLLTGFEVIREPGVVKAGNFAYIPDFLIKKGEKELYIEIAGFWTKEYIKRKIEKIKSVKAPIVLVAREELVADKGKIKNLDIVIMKGNKIPYRDILIKIKKFLT